MIIYILNLMKNYQNMQQVDSPARLYKQSPVICKKNFERELEERLQHLKQRQTTTRKQLIKTTNEKTIQQPKYDDYNKNLMEQFSKISEIDKNHNKVDRTEIRHEMYDNLNQKMGVFLSKYFQDQSSIEVIQFIQASVIEFSLPKLREEELQIAAKIISKDLTTTNQNEISLNALQILLKKIHIRDYLIEKIYLSKYKLKKIQLQKQCENLLKSTQNQQYNFKKRQQSIKTRQYQLKKQIQELVTRQKTIKERQKQLQKKEKAMMERQKLSKDIIKEKGEKMFQEYMKEIQKVGQNVSQKIVNFQKGAKNKLNTIEKKMIEVNKMKIMQFSAQQKQAQKQILKNKTIQDLQNKLKNIQKQAQKVKKGYEEQFIQLQTENKQFLKASTILQNKQEKTMKKMEKLNDELQKKQEQIVTLKMELNEKQILNQKLIVALKNSQIQQNQQNIHQKSNDKLQKKKSVKKLTKKVINSQESVQKITNFYDYLLNLLLNQQNQDLKNRNEAVLMQYFQQIYERSWNLIKNYPQKLQQFNNTVQLVVKVGITKLNFLKYQQVSQVLVDPSQQSRQVKDFINNLICIRQEQFNSINLSKNLKNCHDKFRKNYCIYYSMGINSKNSPLNHLSYKTLQQLFCTSDQFLTFILEKYLSSHQLTNEKWQLYLLDNFLELSKDEKFLHSLFLLHNYRYFFDLIVKIPLQKKITNFQQELIEKLLIIMQRISYKYNQQVMVSPQQLSWLEKCEQIYKVKQPSSLILANCHSILSNIQRTSQC